MHWITGPSFASQPGQPTPANIENGTLHSVPFLFFCVATRALSYGLGASGQPLPGCCSPTQPCGLDARITSPKRQRKLKTQWASYWQPLGGLRASVLIANRDDASANAAGGSSLWLCAVIELASASARLHCSVFEHDLPQIGQRQSSLVLKLPVNL